MDAQLASLAELHETVKNDLDESCRKVTQIKIKMVCKFCFNLGKLILRPFISPFFLNRRMTSSRPSWNKPAKISRAP